MTNDTADLLGFGTPPSASVAATTPPSSDIAGQVDLLGFGTNAAASAPVASSSSGTRSAATTKEHYESPTTVASLQQNMNSLDLLSGAPEVDILDDTQAALEEEEKTEIVSVSVQAMIPTSAAPSAAAGSAPALAGMSKISRKSANGANGSRQTSHQPKRRPRIIVPHRSIGMGLDVKFEEDPTRTNLCNIIAPHEYRAIVSAINDDLREVRATGVDKALMATAPLVVPLAVFGRRQSRRSREKKLVLHEAIQRFNDDNPTLRMMWTKSVAGDYLCIVERDDALDVPIAVNNQLPTGLE